MYRCKNNMVTMLMTMIVASSMLLLISSNIGNGNCVVDAFTTTTTTSSKSLVVAHQQIQKSTSTARTKMNMASLLDNLPNPFASNNNNDNDDGNLSSKFGGTSASYLGDGPFIPTPDNLIARTKILIATDLGILDPTLLDDEKFVWIGSSIGSKFLNKQDYIAAGKFFNLRETFPDLDLRPHDFRIIEDNNNNDSITVRFTSRGVGTMRGQLRLRNNVIVQPNGKQIIYPPEAISITYDTKTGKVTKICSGYTLDRLVGNTNGLCGVMGASVIASSDKSSSESIEPKEYEYYPITSVITRFFGRPTKQLQNNGIDNTGTFLAPFPETVMIQLAKGIISSNMAYNDPDLLSNKEFTFYTPYEGPVNKKQYIDKYAKSIFGDGEDDTIEPGITNYRVDPYDPYRVWVDSQPVGDNNNYISTPQAMSFTFDDDGFCIRMTAWAVMDPSIGNTGGLGGVAGYRYATGSPLPGIISRPLPDVFGRLQKRLSQPITKINVDEYEFNNNAAAPPSATTKSDKATTISISKKPETPPTEAIMKKKSSSPISPISKIAAPPKTPPPTTKEPSVPFFAGGSGISTTTTTSIAATDKSEAEAKKAAAVAAAKKQREDAAKAKAEAAAAVKKQREEATRAKAEAAAAAKQQRERAAAAAAEKKAAEKAKQAQAQKAKQQADKIVQQAKPGVTISLFGLGNQDDGDDGGKAKAATEAKQRQEEAAKAKAEAAAVAKRQREEAAAAAKQQREAAAQAKAEAAAMAKQQREEAARAKAEAAAMAKQQREEAAAASAAAAKKKAAEKAKQAQSQKAKQQAAKIVRQARPGGTISLFGLGKRDDDDDNVVIKTKAQKKPAPPKKVDSAPKGVPTITNWSQNRDGSISGKIYGSPNFSDGDSLVTSPIQGDASGGMVIQTESGSRYFLDPKEKKGASFRLF